MHETLDRYVGPTAGVAASVLWTATSLLLTAGSKRVGPTLVNGFRIAVALILLGATHRLLFGAWIPEATGGQVVLLALSGIVGLCIGDQALLTAFVDIGPRLAMLIMTAAPLFAAFFGWVALGETLHAKAWLGITLTVSGVAWVVVERPRTREAIGTTRRARGIILAFVGAVCQAGGLLLTKQGMGHGWLSERQLMDPQAAALIRMAFAGMGVCPMLMISALRERRRRRSASHRPRVGSRRVGLLLATLGAVVGPYLGVWTSLIAVDRSPLGVAQTLCSLSPIFILPCVAVIHKEHISSRAAVGAAVAVTGTSVLFFPGA